MRNDFLSPAVTVMKGGHPCAVDSFDHDKVVDAELLSDMTDEEQRTVLKWISVNVTPGKTPNERCNSYGMKFWLEQDTRLYLTNNQFKDAMLLSGYQPVEQGELNWHFCISSKSKFFDQIGKPMKRR